MLASEYHGRAGREVEFEPLDSVGCVERIRQGEVLYGLVDIAVAPKFGTVGRQYCGVGAAGSEYAVVGE